jgi:GH24 family phage-related lysozyme (muramidase)
MVRAVDRNGVVWDYQLDAYGNPISRRPVSPGMPSGMPQAMPPAPGAYAAAPPALPTAPVGRLTPLPGIGLPDVGLPGGMASPAGYSAPIPAPGPLSGAPPMPAPSALPGASPNARIGDVAGWSQGRPAAALTIGGLSGSGRDHFGSGPMAYRPERNATAFEPAFEPAPGPGPDDGAELVGTVIPWVLGKLRGAPAPKSAPTPARTRPAARSTQSPEDRIREQDARQRAAVLADFRTRMIRKEGDLDHVYKDHKGNLTVGIGHLLPRNGKWKEDQRITAAQKEAFWQSDSDTALKHAQEQMRLAGITDPEFLLDLADVNFQLGQGWRSRFPKTWAYIMKRQYAAAAAEALDSEWYRSPTKDRAVTFHDALMRLERLEQAKRAKAR